MTRLLYIIASFFFTTTILSSCSEKNKKTNNNTILTEKFTDSTQVGHQGENKIELVKFLNRETDKSFILLEFYTRKNSTWKLIQRDTINAGSLTMLVPEIRDYNSDGINDLRFCSDIGANLADPIYTIMVFSSQAQKLKKIGEGWNLAYSDKLKMFREKYIASTTECSFYKIQGDSLKKAFEVDLTPTHEYITEFDRHGNIIRADSSILRMKDTTLRELKHWIREWALKDSLD